MKILQVLTYYRPHVSGLTIYVERLSQALVRQGHEVTVLTSQYDSKLPLQERNGGVNIQRVTVAARVSKGVLMPTFGHWATKFARQADIIHLHLPQFDAPGLALRGRFFGKPVVITYHCDLQLPQGAFNRAVDKVVSTMNQTAGTLAHAIVTYTRDYGENTPFLRQYMGRKLHIIPPPVELEPCSEAQANSFRLQHQLGERPIIGISARLATEKGVEVLLNALPRILEAFPNALVLHAGPTQKVLGEEAYAARLAPLFEQYKASYRLLGTLHGAELTAFYKNLDCLVISSLNSTESFGLVQIEAMQNGVPVVASNLPGVRQPVTMTGMGEVTPIGDHEALAEAVVRVLGNKAAYVKDGAVIGRAFSPDQTAEEYLRLFRDLLVNNVDKSTAEPRPYQLLRLMRDGQLPEEALVVKASHKERRQVRKAEPQNQAFNTGVVGE
ncbi:MAG: glycosyltransferase family 4 protein [Chloroflexi bacterium]|nr:glycosyltransferase family 4 protein [Chloroflexota bacterium]